MASTILYKFQSGTTFEALPLPGSAARLFDVKKAIVKAKKLDNSGSMEFDLAVRNADTNEEYANESLLLPRGTRLIVQRLPAPRGHGFLARMARNEHSGGPMMGGGGGASHHHQQQQPIVPGSAPSGYYTIDSRARDDDEFVQGGGGGGDEGADDEKELAALQAATNMQSSGPAMTGGGFAGGGGGGGQRGGGPPRPGGGGGGGAPKPTHYRPNADPELRDQEKQLMPKKRATGIPRTFLNLNAPPQTEATKEGEEASNVPLLQPNTMGLRELVSRGGGQSENTAGTRRDLDYALKLTATTVPEHLQCGICNGVVKNAMLLPWDPEGRTACEICIRDALTQNGFRCPLTGMDGVSPDDLIPNVGLRKAADLFIQGVMEKVDEIEQQQVEETEMIVDSSKSAEANVLDGDGVEKGVIVSKKMTLAGRKKDSDDPFGGGDDDFGGDVFAVEADKPNEEEETVPEKVNDKDGESSKKDEDKKINNEVTETQSSPTSTKEADKQPNAEKPSPINNDNANSRSTNGSKNEDSKKSNDSSSAPKLSVATDARPEENRQETPKKTADTPVQKRRERRRRGPPAGYSVGPARATGARAVVPQLPPPPPPQDDRFRDDRAGGGGVGYPPPTARGGGRGGVRGGFRGGRGGRGGRGRFGAVEPPDRKGADAFDDDSSRGTKRSYDDHISDVPSPRQSSSTSRYDRHDDRYGDDRGGGRGGRGGHRGDYGGGRGDRGGPPPPPPPRGGSGPYRGGGRGGGFRGRGGGGGGYRGGGRGGYTGRGPRY